MAITVYAGETVRVVNNFFDFDNIPKSPQLVRFKVYNRKYEVLLDVMLTEANKLDEGKYFYDYITPPESNQTYTVEFYGEIAGNPTIERQQIYTTFIK